MDFTILAVVLLIGVGVPIRNKLIRKYRDKKKQEDNKDMEKETMETVISVTKQWWLKVNRKPARAHAMDGAAFPHTIKVKYTIDGKDYICRKWIGAGNKVPDKGTTIKVTYYEDKPSKARIEL